MATSSPPRWNLCSFEKRSSASEVAAVVQEGKQRRVEVGRHWKKRSYQHLAQYHHLHHHRKAVPRDASAKLLQRRIARNGRSACWSGTEVAGSREWCQFLHSWRRGTKPRAMKAGRRLRNFVIAVCFTVFTSIYSGQMAASSSAVPSVPSCASTSATLASALLVASSPSVAP